MQTGQPPRPGALLPARSLIVIGLTAIALALANYAVFASILTPPDAARLQVFTAQVVDLGIVPGLGLALLFLGLWMYERETNSVGKSTPLRLSALILALLLGASFAILSPVHLLNVRATARETLARIVREGREAEEQIDSDAFKNNLEQRQQILKQQADALLSDNARIEELLAGTELNEAQKEFLRSARENPEEMDRLIQQQNQNFPVEVLGRIRQRRQELEQRARIQALRSGVRTGFSGLVLGAGYLAIAAVGLLPNKKGRRSRPSQPPQR
jgi:hypothetical protein